MKVRIHYYDYNDRHSLLICSSLYQQRIDMDDYVVYRRQLSHDYDALGQKADSDRSRCLIMKQHLYSYVSSQDFLQVFELK